jgi:hypothetical protein
MRREEKRREEMNGVMSEKKMEVINPPTHRPANDMVMFSCRAFPLFFFVLFHTASLPRCTLDTLFSRPSMSFLFFFFVALLGVLSPYGLGLARTWKLWLYNTQKHHSLSAGLWCTVLYCTL